MRNLIKKSRDEFDFGLLAYRATALTCGKSPAAILYNSKLRTDLSILEDQLYTSNREEITIYRKASQEKQKNYYDRTTHQLPKLQEGDVVRLWNSADTAWTKEQFGPRSYIVSTENAKYRRIQKTF